MQKLIFVLPAITGGGAERVVLNLYKALAFYKNYECHILCFSRNIAHKVDSSYSLHFLDQVSSIKKNGFYRLTYRKKIAKIIDKYIDITFGKNCLVLSNMMFADKVMSLSKHKVYHIIHSSYTQSVLGNKSFFLHFFIKKNINNIYSHHPLIFVSKGALDSFCTSFISNVNMYVIYNPVNEIIIEKLSNETILDLNYDYIIHVGRFNRAKRHDRLLNAFSKTKSNIKLLLLGDGKLESEINLLIDKLNLRERTVLLGFKENPYPYIKKAKVLILSSDFEGLPTVIIEACSLGVPVISTDCPSGIREIIKETSPSIVPLDDINRLAFAIDDALHYPEKYISPLNKKFKNESVAEQYDNLFNLNE